MNSWDTPHLYDWSMNLIMLILVFCFANMDAESTNTWNKHPTVFTRMAISAVAYLYIFSEWWYALGSEQFYLDCTIDENVYPRKLYQTHFLHSRFYPCSSMLWCHRIMIPDFHICSIDCLILCFDMCIYYFFFFCIIVIL